MNDATHQESESEGGNPPMKVLELFAGTRSIGKAFEAHGHQVFSVEIDTKFENIDLYKDVLDIDFAKLNEEYGPFDVLWGSPPCTSYSVAAIGHHREKDPQTGELRAKTDGARLGDRLVLKTLEAIDEVKPKFWFIENPMAGLRTMSFMKGLPRYLVTYCQYGDTRRKATDIWTNIDTPNFKPPCKNGDKCHESAPRGSRTGTQGLKGAKERAVIPPMLCEYIVYLCENPLPKDRGILCTQSSLAEFGKE